jgi:beta-N-acetylhexosaminidase
MSSENGLGEAVGPEVGELSYAVLFPAFAESALPDQVASFIERGGITVLLAETMEEYDARKMSAARRARETPASFRALTDEIRSIGSSDVLVALDHELGGIQRCEGLVSDLPTIAEASAMDHDTLYERCYRVGSELRELGVDIVLSPVLDLIGTPNPWLDGRLISHDPAEVASVGATFVEALEKAGLATCPKHFPGHSALATNPLVNREAVVHRSRAELAQDLVPFQSAFAHGARCVMVGPGTFPDIEDRVSAVLSPQMHRILRETCAFTGLVISDDLDAPSVVGDLSVTEAAISALTVGNDLLLLPADNDLDGVATGIATAVASDRLDLARLRDAGQRIRDLAAQLSMGR